MDQGKTPEFVLLAILDGWGIAPDSEGNAINKAKTPNFKRFMLTYPHTQLSASGEAVGLPRGEDGNTETGHLNLGAGKVIYQDLERINMSIADGSFFENKVLINAFEHAKKNNSNLHVMGLVGAGGVHSNLEHLFAILNMANDRNFRNVYLHLFTDGRDSPPTSAATYINKVKDVIKRENVGEIATIMGRYWAMDRDQRWDRTKKAYDAIVNSVGKMTMDVDKAIKDSYKNNVTDEFIEPTILVNSAGIPVGQVKDNDSVIFYNFRIDRPRQLTMAFVVEDFDNVSKYFDFDPYSVEYEKKHLVKKATKPTGFKREKKLKNLFFVTMTQYSKNLEKAGAHPAFPPELVDYPIGAVIAENGLHQLRITESEKERFVTFYFNGLREVAYENEDRIIIPSPKVATYDLAPEMSIKEVTKTLIKKLNLGIYKFIVLNFPNADMVGHTGNIEACIKGVEAIDNALGELERSVNILNGAIIVTADHGNAEEMINLQTKEVDTEHSTNPVPFICVYSKFKGNPKMLSPGILADISPTILSLMKLTIPQSMSGKNLLSGVLS